MDTFDELKATVECIHNRTGDAVMEIGHAIDHAHEMVTRWEDCLSHADNSKQGRQWEKTANTAHRQVAYLERLLSIAGNIICAQCGHYVNDPNHSTVTLNGGGFEPDEDTCFFAGVPANEYVPF